MPQKHANLSGSQAFHAEVRDVVVKSAFTGVAATVLVVTMCSPAGLGGMVGTSIASLGFSSLDPSNSGEPAVNFPRVPLVMSSEELSGIHERIAGSVAMMDNIRAATDAEIDHMRQIASDVNMLAFGSVVGAADIIALNEPVEPEPPLALRDQHLELAELFLGPSTAMSDTDS